MHGDIINHTLEIKNLIKYYKYYNKKYYLPKKAI
jgi:hypothetical protein